MRKGIREIILVCGLSLSMLVGCGKNEVSTSEEAKVEEEIADEPTTEDVTDSAEVEEEIQPEAEEKVDENTEEEIAFDLNEIGKTYMEGNYEYTVLEDGTVEISCYNGNDSDITTPLELGGYVVSSIGEGAFNFTQETKIHITENIRNIADSAIVRKDPMDEFIITAELDEGVEVIGDYGLCSADYNMPASVKSVGMGNYYYKTNQHLEEYGNLYYLGDVVMGVVDNSTPIEFREDTRVIAANAFSQYKASCMDEKIIIPEGVEYICHSAFMTDQVFDMFYTFDLPNSLVEIEYWGVGCFNRGGTGVEMTNEVKIYGSASSCAEDYAKYHGFEFVTKN